MARKFFRYSVIILLIIFALLTVIYFTSVHHNIEPEVHTESMNTYVNHESSTCTLESSVYNLSYVIYAGLPFEQELDNNKSVFTTEDMKVLTIFATSGIKSIEQIKKDFLKIEKEILSEENVVKNIILKMIINIQNLYIVESMKNISYSLFIADYPTASIVANTVEFNSTTSKKLLDRWVKDLDDYIKIDNVIKKYL